MVTPDRKGSETASNRDPFSRVIEDLLNSTPPSLTAESRMRMVASAVRSPSRRARNGGLMPSLTPQMGMAATALCLGIFVALFVDTPGPEAELARYAGFEMRILR